MQRISIFREYFIILFYFATHKYPSLLRANRYNYRFYFVAHAILASLERSLPVSYFIHSI